MIQKKHLFHAFVFMLMAVLFLPGLLYAEGYKELESKVVKHTLPNGLRVLVLERHVAPVASFVTWADVGSANEVKGITGLPTSLNTWLSRERTLSAQRISMRN